MTKIVIAKSHAGFGLSDEAMEAYFKAKNIPFVKEWDEYVGGTQKSHNYYIEGVIFFEDEISRNDPDLVRIVEEMGRAAWMDDFSAELKVVEIPDGVNWEIRNYDSKEWVAEVHRTWS